MGDEAAAGNLGAVAEVLGVDQKPALATGQLHREAGHRSVGEAFEGAAQPAAAAAIDSPDDFDLHPAPGDGGDDVR